MYVCYVRQVVLSVRMSCMLCVNVMYVCVLCICVLHISMYVDRLCRICMYAMLCDGMYVR